MTGAPPGRWNHNTHYYDRVLAAAPAQRAVAVDVGCGDGLLVRALATRYRSVIGVDTSAQMTERARTENADLPNAEFVTADFLSWPRPDASVDLVTAVASAHHMPLGAALGRMARLLRPGGTLVVIGLANNAHPLDRAISAAGLAAHWALSRRYGTWQHSAPLADPDLSWAQVRAVARSTLPGVRWRRHLLWRYSLTWTKPAAS